MNLGKTIRYYLSTKSHFVDRLYDYEQDSLAPVFGDLNIEPGFVSSGKDIYAEKCLTCHGHDLAGGTGGGLNLVDTEWKWGNQPMSVYAVVTNGSPDKTKGMQSWVAELGPQKVSQVVAYVLSHHTEEDMAEATTLNTPVGL